MKKVRLVEIELFSYCNRKCIWCPNSFVDRRSENIAMQDVVFHKLLRGLKNSLYQGAITFSRYNEPLSKPDIFIKRLREIKSYLPENKLVTNTNGDFFSGKILDKLLIDELTIMDYDRKGIDWCVQRLRLMGVTVDKEDYPYVFGHYKNMQILIVADWPGKRVITDRGGTLKQYSGKRRQRPCFEPERFIGINYDGTVFPCCNIRNDIESLKPYIIGNLNKDSLADILSGRKAAKFRKNCSLGIFSEGSPCYYCQNSGGRYTRGKGGIAYA